MATLRPLFPKWNDNNPADMVGYYDRYTGEKFILSPEGVNNDFLYVNIQPGKAWNWNGKWERAALPALFDLRGHNEAIGITRDYQRHVLEQAGLL